MSYHDHSVHSHGVLGHGVLGQSVHSHPAEFISPTFGETIGQIVLAGFIALVLLTLPVAAQSTAAQSTSEEAAGPAPQKTSNNRQFFDQVDVSLRTVVARVVNRRGEPLLDLTTDDLIAKVDGKPVPIVALDWYTGTSDSAASIGDNTIDTLTQPDLGLSPEMKQLIIESTGRLVVIFVQIGHAEVITLDESYITGHLKLLPHLRGLLDELDPEDRVAVVSYDSHLKVWLDFSLDREAANAAIYDGIGFGKPNVRRNQRLSLFEVLDDETMTRATTPEKALIAIARALEGLPGIKDMIFVGWGLGRYTHGIGVLLPKDFTTAVNILGRAQATVSVLDVTQAESHALASGLKTVAAATGGTYASTYDAVGRKVDQLGRTLQGYYIVSLDRNAMPTHGGTLKLSIDQRDISVLHKPRMFPPLSTTGR